MLNFLSFTLANGSAQNGMSECNVDVMFGALQDQSKRYTEIKQSDMPAGETARKTKEFRCPPREQVLQNLVGYKIS